MTALELLIPLGILGFIRWATWLIRRIPAAFYRPVPTGHREPLSLVTPVYQEDPEIFRAAIDSWLAAGVAEIIAVVDVTDTTCMAIARERGLRLIVTDVPGKRDALRRGWEAATHDLVALVDSDTIWAAEVAERVCAPFADPRVGGVGTRQNAYQTGSVWQKLADAYLDYRYFDELPSQSFVGQAVSCLSGRTAVYRRAVLLEISEEFMAETFWGVPCNSGDDKRLTMLTLKAGYRTIFQQNARVYSTFPDNLRGFVKQRLRWARNTWRSDLRALGSGWLLRRHRWLAFVMLDKVISPFTLLLSLGFMLYAVAVGHLVLVAALLGWWCTSRTAKSAPHLRQRPARIIWIPVIVAASFLMAGIRLAGLVTIRQQRWLTRQVAVVDGRIQRVGGAGSPRPATPPVAAVAPIALWRRVGWPLAAATGGRRLASALEDQGVSAVAAIVLVFGAWIVVGAERDPGPVPAASATFSAPTAAVPATAPKGASVLISAASNVPPQVGLRRARGALVPRRPSAPIRLAEAPGRARR